MLRFAAVLVTAALLISCVTAAPTTRRTLHPRVVAPLGWTELLHKPVPVAHQVRFSLYLRSGPASETLERHAIEVSDPTHASYQLFKTASQIAALTAPSANDVTLVESWLRGIGARVERATPTTDELVATATVAQLNRGLETRFAVYRHEPTQTESIRTAHSITVPGEIDAAVSITWGLTDLIAPEPVKDEHIFNRRHRIVLYLPPSDKNPPPLSLFLGSITPTLASPAGDSAAPLPSRSR